MPNFNKVIMMGHLTRDVEMKYLESGTALAKFGLAVSRKYKSGETTKEEVCFIDCEAWGKLAEICEKYLDKGSPVLIEGRLKHDRWENEGQKRSKHGIVVEKLEFLPKRDKKETESQETAKKFEQGEIPF